MAVFFKNECKFRGCNKIFSTLPSLIEHIENTHIDFSPAFTEELEKHQPTSLPLSYVLRYSQNSKETEDSQEETETLSESESSSDSWTPIKEYPPKINSDSDTIQNSLHKERPFGCSIPGCTKRYKNINGIKYHYKNGHNTPFKPRRVCKQLGKIRKQKSNKSNKLSYMTSKTALDLKWNDLKAVENNLETKPRVLTLLSAPHNTELNYTSTVGDVYGTWYSYSSGCASSNDSLLLNLEENAITTEFL